MKVTYSDYLQTRKFNRKLYEYVAKEMKRSLVLCDDVHVEFSMSAKHQTPFVTVVGEEATDAVDIIHHILDTFFQVDEPEPIPNGWSIDFQD